MLSVKHIGVKRTIFESWMWYTLHPPMPSVVPTRTRIVHTQEGLGSMFATFMKPDFIEIVPYLDALDRECGSNLGQDAWAVMTSTMNRLNKRFGCFVYIIECFFVVFFFSFFFVLFFVCFVLERSTTRIAWNTPNAILLLRAIYSSRCRLFQEVRLQIQITHSSYFGQWEKGSPKGSWSANVAAQSYIIMCLSYKSIWVFAVHICRQDTISHGAIILNLKYLYKNKKIYKPMK